MNKFQCPACGLKYREMLERLEWEGWHPIEEIGCPCCGAPRSLGHKDDCALAVLLRE